MPDPTKPKAEWDTAVGCGQWDITFHINYSVKVKVLEWPSHGHVTLSHMQQFSLPGNRAIAIYGGLDVYIYDF